VDSLETVADAARREVKEETGIDLARESVELTPLCIWESAYPTSVALCEQAGGLKRQHIVVYFVARISGALAASSRKCLDWGALTADGVGTEVDCACWLPLAGLQGASPSQVGGGEELVCDALGLEQGVAVEALDGDGSQPATVDAGQQLRGIYPNAHGGGMSRGSLFALAILARSLGACAGTTDELT
jgi:hypothetical protein